MSKQIINTPNAPAPIGPYSHSVKAGNLLFVSGQIPIDPSTNTLVSGGIITETHQVMRNIKAILEEAKLTFEHVVKTTIFLSDMTQFTQDNEVYGSYFSGDYPARECVAVKTLPKNVAVEISVIATVTL
jgi:2-iminobutanoate/2-iminopropanoate deaminase